MIEIRQKETGAVLARVNAATLERANLGDRYLVGADLKGAQLQGAS
jgi:uncharacterized protein YjbI with pentapeptide repeats